MTRSWPDLSGRLDGGCHILPVRIYFEDTDFSGVVYHANYLRFMERGRSDFMRLAGADHRALFEADDRIAFVVRRMTLSFERPARMDDIVEILTEAKQVRGASMTLSQRITRKADLLVAAEVQVALVSASGRARRIPPELRAVLTMTQRKSG